METQKHNIEKLTKYQTKLALCKNAGQANVYTMKINEYTNKLQPAKGGGLFEAKIREKQADVQRVIYELNAKANQAGNMDESVRTISDSITGATNRHNKMAQDIVDDMKLVRESFDDTKDSISKLNVQPNSMADAVVDDFVQRLNNITDENDIFKTALQAWDNQVGLDDK
jgi:predicted transcriptional regulator